jgi:hypothetical protein
VYVTLWFDSTGLLFPTLISLLEKGVESATSHFNLVHVKRESKSDTKMSLRRFQRLLIRQVTRKCLPLAYSE